jgi:acyl-CoA synthetase (AMP-forming)/AMP-acid ligase II
MLDELLARQAARGSDSPFLATPSRTLSYGQALELSRGAAAGLRARGLERVAFHAADSPELVVALCACASARCESAVLSRSYRPEEIDDLCRRFELDTVICDRGERALATRSVPIDEVVQPTPLPAGPTAPDREARLIVLTTGTTGPPKGAIYTWANLVQQAPAKDEFTGTRWLLAYHLNHFAGIQMLVHVLVNRACLVIPESPAISDAIRALFEGGVECVSATPTFWRFLIAQCSAAELRRLALRQITLGGEAVPENLVGELRRLFPSARVSQVFATTEAGSCFSVTDREHGFPASVLDRPGDAPVQLKIMDGELHIRSANGMLGYFGDDLSRGPSWRPTGDLVEVRDGRVYFTGRTTEVINVGGVKVNPLPIEDLVSRVPGVVLAHVYGRPNPITGRVVAVDVVAQPGVDSDALEQSIRKACAALERHSAPRLIRIVDEVEMKNRKIVRRGDVRA